MMPFVAKTWGLRGETPVLRHRARHRQKVSVIGAVGVSPGRGRCRLFFNTHLNASVNDRKVAAFLRDLLRHLRGHVVVVWDRINSHRSRFLRDWIDRRPRLHAELLPPPYAPELNPVEWFWETIGGNGPRRSFLISSRCDASKSDLNSANSSSRWRSSCSAAKASFGS